VWSNAVPSVDRKSLEGVSTSSSQAARSNNARTIAVDQFDILHTALGGLVSAAISTADLIDVFIKGSGTGVM
jgi:hypothetical protein